MRPFTIRYDDTVDAGYVSFEDRGPASVGHTEILDDVRMVDYGHDGALLGVELLDISRGVQIAGLPEPDAVRAALEQLASERGWPSVVVE